MTYYNLINERNPNDITFELNNNNNNIKIALANAIRRVGLSEIPIYGIEKENVKVFINSSVLNSSILIQRLTLCPVYTNKYMDEVYDNINITLNVTNNEDIIKSIYLSDFKIENNKNENIDINKIFPIPNILFGKLKYNEKISLMATITKGNAKIKGANFCSVGTISYSFKEDQKLIENKIKETENEEEKRKIKLLTCEKYYKKNNFDQPNNYIFRIETVENMSSYELLRLIYEQLKNKLNKFIDNINNNENENIIITKPDTNIDIVQYEIRDEDYTLGNLIKSYAYDLDEIKYSGYAKFHPLDNLLTIRLSNSNDNNINKMNNTIITIANNIIKIIDELIKEL